MTMGKWYIQLDYRAFLDETAIRIVEIVGLDKYFELVEEFGKSQVYFSEVASLNMKREFVRQNRDRYSTRELARLLDVSESWVYKVR